MTTALQPVEFTPPRVAPAHPLGLIAATTWIEQLTGETARRWLPAGIQFRLATHSPTSTFGVWGAPWCVDPDNLEPDDVKAGPAVVDDDPEPFVAMTVFGSDRLQQCGNLSAFDRAQAVERARHTLALREPLAIETEFATRLLADAPSPTAAIDLVEAVGLMEQQFAATGTFGLIHARGGLLALAEHLRLVVREPAAPEVLRTPAGHRWVFGAGYATPIGDSLIGTSPTYGWRDEIEVREALHPWTNQFLAVAERSVVIGYEAVIGAAEITP